MSMLDAVNLLTRSVEQPILAPVLLGHNPLLTIRPAATSNDIAALAPELLRRARLVAFTTDVLVPPQVLDQTLLAIPPDQAGSRLFTAMPRSKTMLPEGHRRAKPRPHGLGPRRGPVGPPDRRISR
jgi:hypothetical protein